MARIHLFEFEDQAWFPSFIRDGLTDFLRVAWEVSLGHRPVLPLLVETMKETGSTRLVDLCSGGSGPLRTLAQDLKDEGTEVSILMTDKFPNLTAFQRTKEATSGLVDFVPESVDATAVPDHLQGFRTLFASFHHFQPETARAILQDAVDKGQPIGVFEFTERSVLGILSIFPAPITTLVLTPLVRPLSLGRIFWTCLVPVIPLLVLWDGFVSHLRTYSLKELEELTNSLSGQPYTWRMGKARGTLLPIPVTYLIGVPQGTSKSIESNTPTTN